MSKYGTAAMRAREIGLQGAQSADGAWRQAAAETFPNSVESRRKSCPWGAYRGLCAAGLVRGVTAEPTNTVAEENANGTYAITAARLLAADPELAKLGPAKLWRRVMEELGLDPTKAHNKQMDVVLSLWNAGQLASR
jgi:hypothetical protein